MKTRLLVAVSLAALLLPVAPAAAALPDVTVQYSDGLTYTVRWTQQDGSLVGLSVSGLPDGLTFTDNGDNTGAITGIAQSPADNYPLVLTATEDGGTQHEEDLSLVVLREDAVVRMAMTNPVSVSRQRSFVVKARVKDRPDGSLGDITRADPGVFIIEDQRGHLRTCPAAVVPGSLDTGAGPDFYDVRCRVPSGLHRGTFRLTYAVAGGYYSGWASSQVRITR